MVEDGRSTMTTHAQDPAAVVRRLIEATNRHDLPSMLACFAPDYRNETPVHPSRGFLGREQVRRNWMQIFAAVPDLQTRVLDSAVVADQVWTEQEHHGTRADGTPHVIRGVVIFRVAGDMVTHARFYLEPLDVSSGGVDEAVRRHATGELR
jgi:ketosteroid isomerase-like protein